MSFENKIEKRLEFIYGSNKASDLANNVKELIEKYGYEVKDDPGQSILWSQEDVVLITYGDIVLPSNGETNKLQALQIFLEKYLDEAINSVHILPFFPSSSDQGFAVIDYKSVRDSLGHWNDIEGLSDKYRVMADLVINHTSRFNNWFKNYQTRKDPGQQYFIEIDPSTDLSKVTRPRSSPLLTAVKTSDGLRYVWTTFSDDQIDLDFSNPKVLLEFIDIFLFYISKGIKLIRFDAVAYLWKKVGTNSIHLKETHEVVKLFRDIVDHIEPDITLITETNVPFNENVSYFGDGDETHMIYQFSLPPLLLHAILTENSNYLSKWVATLPDPPEGCTYFNFTSSHDGIGVRPLEGLVPDKEFDYLIEGTKERGGFVSYKKNPDGSQSPYELNITYYDAFAEPGKKNTDLQKKRYLCSQTIMLSLQGIPGIYFHNLTATENYIDGVAETGERRAINRKQWDVDELEERLKQAENATYQVMQRFKELLKVRKQHPAFSPMASQKVVDLGNNFFAICRIAEGKKILCISNITKQQHHVSKKALEEYLEGDELLENLVGEDKEFQQSRILFEPFEVAWFKL